MQTTALDVIGELLAERGFDGLADAIRVLLNEIMKSGASRRARGLPDQRAEGQTGQATGFRPKTVQTWARAVSRSV